jgi:hypothetical protein
MNDLQLQIENLKNKFVQDWPKIIDVDEGWYQIVIDCDKELSEIDPDYQIYQIKEKFGTLRYYHKSSQPYNEQNYLKMVSIISKYESLSSCTCEATGLPGLLMKSSTGYYKTLNPQWTSKSEAYSKYTIVKHNAYMPSNDTLPWQHSHDEDYI